MKRKVGRSKHPKPIGPPPMRSRKRARKVTTLFHKLTKLRDEALQKQDRKRVQELELQIDDMGGFDEYQRASQLNTRFHSTSKWVLKVLIDRGVLHSTSDSPNQRPTTDEYKLDDQHVKHTSTIQLMQQRNRSLRFLEIGAINTELVEASKKYPSIHVRAIDLHSSHPDIEEVDFLTMPIDALGYYVIVCSMVLNYVSSPTDRGHMLRLMYQQLRPRGYCFLTLPKLCLDQSPYITKELFDAMLVNEVGFVVEEMKETPKIYFWVLQRPVSPGKTGVNEVIRSLTRTQLTKNGQKFRNSFQVIL